MAGNLLLGRKAKQTVVIYAGNERIEIETSNRTILKCRAEPTVRIIRGELEAKRQDESEAAA